MGKRVLPSEVLSNDHRYEDVWIALSKALGSKVKRPLNLESRLTR